jgi:hypothetical protein
VLSKEIFINILIAEIDKSTTNHQINKLCMAFS